MISHPCVKEDTQMVNRRFYITCRDFLPKKAVRIIIINHEDFIKLSQTV
jgi:hypothetical protein